MNRIPVTLLTGFLGSGKTTVLNALTQQPALSRALVIINEFGEVGLDHLLVAHSKSEGVVELSSGCLCCTIRGDLARTLKDAVWRFSRQGQRQFDRVIVETTGLADPAPILRTLLDDPTLSQHYFVDGIATTVDLVNGAHTLDRHPEARRQAAVADVLLLSKSDLVSPDAKQRLMDRLRGINPAARMLQTDNGKVQAHDMIDLGLTRQDGSARDVQAWLGTQAFERYTPEPAHAHEHSHEHAHEHRHEACAMESQSHTHGQGQGSHHRNEKHRHDDGIQSCSFVLEDPVDPEAFHAWRENIMAFLGDRMLRIKGMLNIAGEPRPMVIHGVQHVFHDPVYLQDWPSPDRSSRLVFIIQDLDKTVLASTLETLRRRGAGT